MITDMDILPMNRTYYTENIRPYDNNKFIYLRDNVCFEYKQIAMCYNVATPSVWRDIFNIHSIDDIRATIKDLALSHGVHEERRHEWWGVDQQLLYKKVMEWTKTTQNFVCLKETTTGFRRLDRGTFVLNETTRANIKNGVFSDYHCFRPMCQYQNINNEIYERL
jgi:hypothetical protein